MTDGTTPQLPFGTALVEAIKRISDQLLLYVLAGAIIVAGVAVGASSVVWPLVGLLAAGIVAWTLLQAMRLRAGKAALGQNVSFGRFTKVTGGIKQRRERRRDGAGRGGQTVKVGAGGRVEGGIVQEDVETKGS